VFLLQKREENELTALVNVGNTRVLMNPNGSPYPVSPNTMMILFAALVLGCGIPFAYYFLRKMLDNTVKSKADLGNISMPFLVEIPRVVNEESRLKKYWFRNDNDKSYTRIMVQHGSRDMMNEAFRVLRTNIDLMVNKNDKSHVLMLTSFNPNAGKTFTVMNLAASMALKGSKVILVDLDLRKATLSNALGLNHTGIASYLNGKTDDYRDHVEKISENLSLLPVGSLPPNPAELLLTDRFKDMIEQLRGEYEYIFLDCPPIDIVADASIIAPVADMTVFIMRANLMDKWILTLVEELYQSGKYTHMALVLNGVDVFHKKYGYRRYGYDHGYGYGYGYGNKD
jgi:capsular exopolysaccharide synthesis family protein